MRTFIRSFPRQHRAAVLPATAALAFTIVGIAAARAIDNPSVQRAVAPGVAADPRNDPTRYAALPPEKKVALDAENAARNRAYASHGTVTPIPFATTIARLRADSPPHQPETDPVAGSGFLSVKSCVDLGHHGGFDYGYWYESVGGGTTRVCAGSMEAAGSLGGVDVMHYPAGLGSLPVSALGDFPTPTRHGFITITGAAGEVLTVQAKDGTVFYFDVHTLSWVDGPGSEKTATPPAGATAAPAAP